MLKQNPDLRQLKIQTGVVKRLSKELAAYEKEQTAQQARIDKLKAANEDMHTIRKQMEVLDETVQMLPDCRRRLTDAHQELQKLVANLLATNQEVSESEDMVAAQTVLKDITWCQVLLIQQVKLTAKIYKVQKQGIYMCLQIQEDYLICVRVIYVRKDSEKLLEYQLYVVEKVLREFHTYDIHQYTVSGEGHQWRRRIPDFVGKML
ncbi:hypothetical protein HDV05_002753 [Chytridiales sp. JEL 0842]|nr:hypothetical protein HDV05_002753 [Chytridiales sp. JEL 0842]